MNRYGYSVELTVEAENLAEADSKVRATMNRVDSLNLPGYFTLLEENGPTIEEAE